jgi:hypothetical protein
VKLQKEDLKALGAFTFSFSVTGVLIVMDHIAWKAELKASDLVAIAAAFIGGIFINRQIRSSERQAERQRNQKFLAARASMPITLAMVITYTRGCARFLAAIHRTRSGGVISPVAGLPVLPAIPDQAVEEFRILIETGPSSIAGPIATLLSLIQVQRARLDDVAEWNEGRITLTVSLPNLEEYILDTAEVYMRASYLFEYGRFDAEVPQQITSASMRSGVMQLGFDMTAWLENRIDRWRSSFDWDFNKEIR